MFRSCIGHVVVGTRALATAAIAVIAALAVPGAGAQESGASRLSEARPGEVRLFASGSLRSTVLAMRGQLEQATGRRLVVESSESRLLQKEIESGQAFEAALLTTAVIRELVAKGRIVAGSEVRIGAVRVGVSVRGDAPRLEVGSVEGLKSAIVNAHGIRRYYGVGASVPVLDNLFSKLGLTESMESRMIRLGGEQVVPEAPLPRGQYELIINLISAIRPMKGWTYLGPIPEQFQMPVDHTAGLGASGDRELGRKVLAVIQSPEFRAALRADGITLE
jgi:molybdate transport system substrate-binding protein